MTGVVVQCLGDMIIVGDDEGAGGAFRAAPALFLALAVAAAGLYLARRLRRA